MLSLAFLCGAILTACGTGGTSSAPSSAPSSEPSSSVPSSSSSEASWEEAMENFAAKLAKNKYSVASDRLTTNVVSKDLVYFDYNDALEIGHDYAGMSVHNETFQTRVDMGEVKGVIFVDRGDAVEVAENLLPSYWFDEEAIGKGIWDMLRVTNPAHPLHFELVDNSMEIRSSMASFAGYEALAVSAIKDVSLDFDAIDVTTVTINAKYDGGTAVAEDLQVVITLGQATTSPVAEAWIADPNRLMPDAVGPKGEWDGNPLGVITTTLMLDTVPEAMEYVPFIGFASYAVWTNMGTCIKDHYGVIRDYHATIRDVEAFKAELVEHFDYTLQEQGGEPVYTRLIRAKKDKGCYITIQVSYDHGFYLKLSLSYEVYRFNTQSALNALIEPFGFPAFAETEAVYNWFGEDDFFLQTENWCYFYDFSVYPVVKLKYDDVDAATKYVEDYGTALEELGFERGINSDNTTWSRVTPECEMNYIYKFDKQGNLSITLKRQEFVDPAEMKANVEAAGYPTVDITSAKIVTCRDNKKFQYIYYVMKCNHAYRNTFYFDNNDDAKKFLGQYKQALLAAGFEQVSGTQYYMKDNLVFEPNEAAGGMVGLYFYERVPE